MNRLTLGLAASALALWMGQLAAQTAYPSKPIRL